MEFQELINKISPKLKGIIHKISGWRPFFAPEDLYQEAMIHLWNEFRQGNLGDKTESYILQGCYFYLQNYIRKNAQKANLVSLSRVSDEEGQEFNLDSLLSLQNPRSCREEANCNVLIEQIRNNGFTTREKEVFLLALEGLTTREIGGRLGISHVRVVKLRQAIKEKCEKYVDFR